MQELLDIFKLLTFPIFSASFRERERKKEMEGGGERGIQRKKNRHLLILSSTLISKCKNYLLFQ